MRVLRTSRSSFSRLTLAFLGLALAVFAWGLQYKLSLYDSPSSPTRGMVEAKLLSQNELSTEREHVLVKRENSRRKLWQPETIGILAVLTLLIAAHPAVGARKYLRAATPPLRRFAALNAFFFRPPPIRL